jgi:hypothetical protein
VFTRHRGATHHRQRLTAGHVARVTRAAGWVTACMLAVGVQSARGQAAGASTDTTAGAARTGIPGAGAYTYTLVPDSSANIKAAINETVSSMNFITRPIARGRLNKVNPLPHRVRVRLTADTVSVAFDDGDPVMTPLDGHVVPWNNALAKETDQAHVVVAGDTVRQTLVAGDGDRENALIFGDRGRLGLRVTVTSHRLPKPLVYELLFRQDSTS